MAEMEKEEGGRRGEGEGEREREERRNWKIGYDLIAIRA